MKKEEQINFDNEKDIEELINELKTQSSKELKQYRNFLFFANIVYRTGFGFAVLFIVIMGISFWLYSKTGNTLILFIGLTIHIIFFQLLLYLSRKDVSSMNKDREEIRKVLSIFNQELNSRKNNIKKTKS